MNAPYFTLHDDGTITVDEFPDEIDISEAFLKWAGSSLIRWHGDLMEITAANGTAIYRIGYWDETTSPYLLGPRIFHAKKVMTLAEGEG